jgi:8-oxo-dGTP pyrophosphatase MutT (NUDIX family)
MRQTAVRALFEEAGCQVEEQRVSRSSANVICKLRGESDSTIVVGGHFGLVDVFVAFAEEETGLEGSSRRTTSEFCTATGTDWTRSISKTTIQPTN